MLGTVVLLAVQLSVVTASHSAGNTFHVSLRVTNDGDAAYELRDADLALLDSTGRRFPVQSVADEIPAGSVRQVGVLFFVPADLRGDVFLEAGALGWTSDTMELSADDGSMRIPKSRRPARPARPSGELPLAPLLEALIKSSSR